MSKRPLNTEEENPNKHARTGQSTFTYNSNNISSVREIFKQNQQLLAENQVLKRRIVQINNMKLTVVNQRDAVIKENQQLKQRIQQLLTISPNQRSMVIDNQLKRNLIY